MRLEEYRNLLKRESAKSCWGCLLIYREQFFPLLYEGMIMLDVGCHVQHLKSLIDTTVPNVTYIGVDIENYGVKIHSVCEAGYLPFRNGVFDLVSYIETLEHLPNPVLALLEARRVLREKGKVYIQTVHTSDPAAANDPTHLFGFEEWSLARIIKWTGYRIVVVKRIGGTVIGVGVK